MKDYTKALNNLKKCLVIVQQALPEGHPRRTITYGNIGDVQWRNQDFYTNGQTSLHRKKMMGKMGKIFINGLKRFWSNKVLIT
jgi:hypothetical protein